MDISRAYYFNWFTQTYSPAFSIVFSQ